ncbi:MAG: hypothetical protein ACTHU0_38700 [Kofleriaceae bacterium]
MSGGPTSMGAPRLTIALVALLCCPALRRLELWGPQVRDARPLLPRAKQLGSSSLPEGVDPQPFRALDPTL